MEALQYEDRRFVLKRVAGFLEDLAVRGISHPATDSLLDRLGAGRNNPAPVFPSFAIVVQWVRRGRASDAGDSAYILVDGPEVMVSHIVIDGPGHYLE